MYKISCFADEISSNLHEQISFMKDHNIKYLSLRSVWGINVLKLSDEQLNIIESELKKNSIGVSSIGSPIGKSDITEDRSLFINQTKQAIKVAKRLSCNRIRVFSFYVKKNALDIYRDEVINRTREMVELCEKEGITLVSENEARIYAETSSRGADLLSAINSPFYRAAFDPSNYVVAGEKPFEESFPRIAPYIDYIHVKDSIRNGEITPAGKGDGQIPELLNALRDRDLFLTLEPHLAYAGKYRGFSGTDRFHKAYTALVEILEKLKVSYI